MRKCIKAGEERNKNLLDDNDILIRLCYMIGMISPLPKTSNLTPPELMRNAAYK